MANLPVVFATTDRVSFLGYASCFNEAYALCKEACHKYAFLFKKADTRCLGSSNVKLAFDKTQTEFPCWLHVPAKAKSLVKSRTTSSPTTKPNKKKGRK